MTATVLVNRSEISELEYFGLHNEFNSAGICDKQGRLLNMDVVGAPAGVTYTKSLQNDQKMVTGWESRAHRESWDPKSTAIEQGIESGVDHESRVSMAQSEETEQHSGTGTHGTKHRKHVSAERVLDRVKSARSQQPKNDQTGFRISSGGVSSRRGDAKKETQWSPKDAEKQRCCTAIAVAGRSPLGVSSFLGPRSTRGKPGGMKATFGGVHFVIGGWPTACEKEAQRTPQSNSVTQRASVRDDGGQEASQKQPARDPKLRSSRQTLASSVSSPCSD
ncbi:hypothetical protein C8R45DRAFT_1073713 [Mycena sanguinolenta]|nr:hypothetical protein C8R45DRAFT_1073713 [Mycena sanguinolenta]